MNVEDILIRSPLKTLFEQKRFLEVPINLGNGKYNPQLEELYETSTVG